MHPKLLEIGSFYLPSYGVLLALAYLSAIYLFARMGEREGMAKGRMLDLGVYVLVSALLGAKLLFLIVDWRYYWANPGELWSTLRTGGVFYGGFFSAAVVAVWYIKKHRMPLWKVLDLAAVCIPLGQSIGRWGCFSAGCCYGKPVGTVILFGHPVTGPTLIFHNAFARSFVGTPLGIPLYPTEVYLSLSALLVFGAMALIYRKRRYIGQVFGWFLILSPALRFLNELFRGDPRGHFLGTVLSTSQGLSLVLLPMGIAILIWRGRRARASARDESERRR